MKYFLGVDAGGSKTYALLTDERGRIRGKGRSGNGNHQLGAEQARCNIAQAVEAALAEAGLAREDVDFAFFGLAGADRPIDYAILRPMIADLGFPQHAIDGDTMIAMRAGTSQPFGVVLICGSGTNSAGKNRAGQFYQCGGFNYPFGDFGGGGALCVEAFRSAIRSWDGREQPTLLTRLVLEHLGYASVADMFDDFMDNEKPIPLELTKLLFEAAKEADAVALDILRRQGEELGKSAVAVIKRLRMEEEKFEVVLAGSVVTRGEGPYIHRYVEEAVSRVAASATIVKLDAEPVVGAVWMAMEAALEAVPREAYDRLRLVADLESVECVTIEE